MVIPIWRAVHIPIYSLFTLKFPLKKTLLSHSVHTDLHGLAFEFAESIGRDPSCRLRSFVGNALRAFDGPAVKARIAFPDLSESSVHGLLDKTLEIRSSFLNYQQPSGKYFVVGGFIMDG